MELVIRIEHSGFLRDGRPAGPYTGDDFYEDEHWDDDCLDDSNCLHLWSSEICWVEDERRPMPHRDGLGYDIDRCLFAFQTVDQMRNWFSGWMTKLDYYGFVAAVYKVKNARHGGSQSIFEWESAIRIGDTSIKNYRAIQKMLDNN